MKAPGIPERFVDEKLALHWQVVETEESFKRLMEHLEVNTNFRPYFERALSCLLERCNSKACSEGLVVLDIGSGVSWTSALLALNPSVRHVYSVEPSAARRKHAEFVLRHFRVPDGKVTLLSGSFSGFTIPEKADCAVLCASFHHCKEEFSDLLFSRIKDLLVAGGIILIANEHYVDFRFTIHRFFSFWKNFLNKKEVFYSLSDLRRPYPFDGEHWRTRRELERVFRSNRLGGEFFVHEGDLCKENLPFYRKMGYHYYHAILKPTAGNAEKV